MTPNFENRLKTSPEGGQERISSEEALAKAVEKTKNFLSEKLALEIENRLESDSTVHLNGVDWELEKLPEDKREAYQDIAFEQKKLAFLHERLERALEKNDTASQATSEEDISYYEVQVLGNLHKYQTDKTNFIALKHSLALQHPDLLNALESHQQN